MKLPANVPGKAENDESSTCVLSIHVKDLEGLLGCWLWLDANLAIDSIWGVNLWVEDSLPLCHCLGQRHGEAGWAAQPIGKEAWQGALDHRAASSGGLGVAVYRHWRAHTQARRTTVGISSRRSSHLQVNKGTGTKQLGWRNERTFKGQNKPSAQIGDFSYLVNTYMISNGVFVRADISILMQITFFPFRAHSFNSRAKIPLPNQRSCSFSRFFFFFFVLAR